MATHFLPCQKMCLAHLGTFVPCHWWKTEEVVRDARFSPHFCQICRLATHFLPLSVCLHPKANICAKFHENWWKTEEVVRDARFPPPPIFAIICRYHATHFLPLSKNVSCTSTPQGKHCAKFHEMVKNWGSSSKFFPHFLPNLPWQHTFYHCRGCVWHI